MALLDKFRQTAESAKESVVELGIKTVIDAGLNKLKEALSEVMASLPIFEEAGYKVHEVKIELSMKPKITMTFKIVSEVNEAKLNEIAQEQQDKKLLQVIAMSLIQANHIRKAATIRTLQAEEVEIETLLGAIPSIVTRFR